MIIKYAGTFEEHVVENKKIPENNSVGKNNDTKEIDKNGKNKNERDLKKEELDERDINNQDENNVQMIIITTCSAVLFCILLVIGIMVYKRKNR